MSKEVFLVGGVRTPNGRYGGALRDVRTVELGGIAGRAALERAGVPADAVDEAIVSNCRQAGNGPNPGRQIALKSGLPERVPAQTLNMACASGLKTLQLASQAILTGAADVVLAVAVESMSTMPFIAPYSLRWEGTRRGDVTLADGWRDGGTDPICGMNMGQTAEKVSRVFGIDRAAQDEWSVRSHQRVARAWDEGRFAGQVVAVDTEHGSLEMDETFRRDTSLERVSRLRPSFEQDGTVTAGNSSQMADGAAGMIVASAEAVERHGLVPRARISSFAAVGVDPTMMGIGPTAAIPAALDKAGLSLADIDLFEINEAFGAQIVQNVRELKLDEERVNVNGGGIALGHPTGQSGLRIVVSLLSELERRGARRGVASLCAGGGMGIAAVVEGVAA
ncbi:thiolase family protein [Amycolatopsis thermophila]|uniref:Probable acetyl-CoA acetyltransferase n=1 Tax=Amycolatopsis thermophila TaxID=206084 RepID=A0ABU0F1H9_9PSEU|nr:thiolase family protein [Amycolatopsis thermophila]MDQ0381358.1 acetyl-CoA C-acetyltransferase [Amycolatopsis thermophila]